MSWRNWRERREFKKILERSSLAHDNLYKYCHNCKKETARDPYENDVCVECMHFYAEPEGT